MYKKLGIFLMFLGSWWTILKAKDLDNFNISEGDIIFHESNSEQSKAIRLATLSPYTHTGIIFKYGNEYKVLEAVEPVKLTPLSAFIKRGKKNHYVIKRLKNRDNILSQSKLSEMKRYGESFLGKHYDIYFGWSDDRIYCTELIWKLYNKVTGKRLGELKTLKDFNLSSMQVQSLMKKRYGNKIPYSEPVISPVDMFESTELETILSAN
ncbi:YiiX family permuted papain-like enzyme [Leptospira kirschneri]|uniref:YiiX family permuted papain-like enzyme n=1 Tax=Leptospira kirschneri TaxID=29507 RepID=UPI000379F0EE|nr:YiiX family permuted papain-like enzyme [Leptospira kirschneri]KON76141.1 Orthopoxovirus protein, PF05708 family [Leptospira kirschneri serovar Mozdok]KON79031.1 Orthopoxovirus protein, PF05708 family [Leptospira kirschneri serovar Mozdok]KPZ76314.1 peptidoglycan peptidase [Leptospira kirschneri serovar Mozdok]NDK07348.1 putative peptidoglycan peptidase [Leptospira kirschneri serovar Mozdok]